MSTAAEFMEMQRTMYANPNAYSLCAEICVDHDGHPVPADEWSEMVVSWIVCGVMDDDAEAALAEITRLQTLMGYPA